MVKEDIINIYRNTISCIEVSTIFCISINELRHLMLNDKIIYNQWSYSTRDRIESCSIGRLTHSIYKLSYLLEGKKYFVISSFMFLRSNTFNQLLFGKLFCIDQRIIIDVILFSILSQPFLNDVRQRFIVGKVLSIELVEGSLYDVL